MTELLLTTLLTCSEARQIATRTVLNNTLPTNVVQDVIAEVRLVAPPDCVLPVIDWGGGDI